MTVRAAGPRAPISRVGVVVPAHDEQEWIGPCLRALAVAAGQVPCPVEIVVVADACSDATAEVARLAGDRVRVVEIGARNVGRARSAGWSLLAPEPDPGCWLATTDADTLVPPQWLARMLHYADEGADAVAGRVRLTDWSAARRPPHVQAVWQSTYAAESAPVHGANLGIRASAYHAVGGVPARALAEDAGLVSALRHAGAAVRIAPDLTVVTSARRSRRAPGGFSSYLSALEDLADDDGVSA
jgi:cellulose synthase/poly-beta-1,6-N-acetylglucosamine synthase-like glycosyltransferase